MASITDIREAIADSLSSLASDVQVSAYMLEAPTGPCVYVFPAEIDYDRSMHRGLDRWTFAVQAMVPTSLDMGAQVNLDRFLEPTGAYSIKELLEASPTLGGLVAGVRVVSCTGYRKYAFEGQQRPPLLGAEWTVEVFSAGI